MQDLTILHKKNPKISGRRGTYPHTCLAASYEINLRQSPNLIALITDEGKFTYAELARMSEPIVAILKEKNPDIAIIKLRRTRYMAATLLALVRCSITYVSLDYNSLPSLCKFVEENSGSEIILTDNIEDAQIFTQPIVLVHELKMDPDSREQPFYTGSPSCELGRVHNIIYTSGTTGNPKGVIVSECGVVNIINDFALRYKFSSTDTLLAITSLCFDPHVYDFFATWMVGATIRLVSETYLKDGVALGTFLDSCSIAQATPSTWNIILQSGWKGNLRLKAISGGESLSTSLAESLVTMCRELHNCWGPTEVTIDGSSHPITDCKDIKLGLPVSNTTIYLLPPIEHDSDQECEENLGVGEICVAGPGVAQGYLNLPEKTAASFVDIEDPDYAQNINNFSEEKRHDHYHRFGSGKMYRTGDMGFFRNGMLHFSGRRDHQVKIRGNRVEIEKVKCILETIVYKRDPFNVSSVYIKTHEFVPGEKVLIAFLERYAPMSRECEIMLREELSQHLSDYEKPVCYTCLPVFPLTGNGKVDGKQLQLVEASKPRETQSIPCNEVELIVIEIVSSTLHRTACDLDDNIFYMGAASLAVTQIVNRLTDKTKINLSVKDINTAKTLKEIARLISVRMKSQLTESNASMVHSTSSSLGDSSCLITVASRANSPSFNGGKRKLADVTWAIWNLLGFALIGAVAILPSWPLLQASLKVYRVYGLLRGMIFIPFTWVAWVFCVAICMTLLKWIFLGRTVPGIHRTDGWFFYRWWLIDAMFHHLVPLTLGKTIGTPIWNLWLKSMGMNTSLTNHIGTMDLTNVDQITIEKYATINDMASISSARIFCDSETGIKFLKIAPVSIKNGSCIGHRSVIEPGSNIQGHVHAMKEPSNKCGSNCAECMEMDLLLRKTNQIHNDSSKTRLIFAMVATIIGLFFLATVQTAAYFPVTYLLRWILDLIQFGAHIDDTLFILTGYGLLQPIYFEAFLLLFARVSQKGVLSALEHPSGISIILSVAAVHIIYQVVLAISVAVIYRVMRFVVWEKKDSRESEVIRHRFKYYILWFTDQLIKKTSRELSVFDGTMIAVAWWRLLGASVKPQTMLYTGTMPFPDPELVDMGTDSECGNQGTLHTVTVCGNLCVYKPVTIKEGCLVGIHAAVLPGSNLPPGITVSVLSVLNSETIIEPDTGTILDGQQIPRRECDDWYKEDRSWLRDTRWLLLQVLFVLLAPASSVGILTGQLFPSVWVLSHIALSLGELAAILLCPFVFLITCLSSIACILLARWLLAPDFRVGVTKDYVSRVKWFRLLFVKHVFQESFALSVTQGSLWYNMTHVGLGAKVPKNCILYSDSNLGCAMLRLEEDVVCNRGVVLQSYVANFGELTTGKTRIKKRTSIGAHSVVMYGCEIDSSCIIDPLSLVMPGQKTDFGCHYAGIPVTKKF